MKKLINYINTNYDKKDIAHIYSIILRANYEYENMKQSNKIKPFKLTQMDNFTIEYSNNHILMIFKNETFNINIKKLEEIINYIYKYFNQNYPINYDYKLIDPIYFSLFFYDLLDKIIDIKYDQINISDIKLLRYKSEPVKLEESERYKAMLDKNYKMYSPFKSNLIQESPEERVEKILKSINKNGYGFNNKYAIFYNDEPYIRDGQHRISAIKYLYGDIDVKIVRIYLKDNYFYE